MMDTLPSLPVHAVLFAAKLIGGEIKCQPGETIAMEWFAFDEIPTPLSAGHAKRIADAIAGVTGAAVLQEMDFPALPENITRQELLERWGTSGLSRQDFYVRLFADAQIKETIEL